MTRSPVRWSVTGGNYYGVSQWRPRKNRRKGLGVLNSDMQRASKALQTRGVPNELVDYLPKTAGLMGVFVADWRAVVTVAYVMHCVMSSLDRGAG